MRALEAYRKADPLLLLHGLAVTQAVADPENRFLRAEALQTLAAKLHSAMMMCNFQNEIIVRPEGIFVAVSDILMESSHTNIYFKSSGVLLENQGEQFIKVLRRLNIEVETMVDVGANFGEISLSLARAFPNARILAIEPSSDNLNVFVRNKSVQKFSTQNIQIIQMAVSDKAEVASIQRGANPMSRILPASKQDRTESVQCERLDTLFDLHGIQKADFVKIDVEGHEPKLKEALVALGNRVRCYLIEFSQFAPFEDYLSLAAVLLDLRFKCYDLDATTNLMTTDDIARHLRVAFASSKIAVSNLWFIAEA